VQNAELPLVSVVVPILNRARFLVPTLESILQQDYPRVECIVVDGGSTDGTVDILRRYGDRIRWISEPDHGHADAINKGWWMSSGEILAWLNADDVYVVPNAISQAVAFMEDHPQVDVVYGDIGRIDEVGNVLRARIAPRTVWDLRRAVLFCDHIIFQPASFIRRRVLEAVGWLDPAFHYGKDRELWLRLGLVARFEYVPVRFAYERATRGLSQDGEKMADACVRLMRKFFSLPNLPGSFRDTRFQRRALSSAYLRGALYCWSAGRYGSAIGYVKMALKACPWNAPLVLKALGWEMGSAVYRRAVPADWREKIRPFLRRMGIVAPF
jgi:glycosyltransferase involved in cell wall biosynthesis